MPPKIVRKKMKGGLERMVLLGLITSTPFVQKVQPILDRKAFSSNASSLIAKWCLDHYDEHGEAPDRDIQVIFEAKSQRLHDDDLETVEELLEQISEELDRRGNDFSCDFALQQALQFFQEKTLEHSVEEIQDLLDSGDFEAARDLFNETEVPEYEQEQIDSENILTDVDTLRKGFENNIEPLIRFPNALGKFVNKLLIRKGFVAVLAPEKRGKTWWLDEIAIQGLKKRLNVAVFNCGDLDNEEQAVRFAVRLSRKSDDKEYCKPHYSPVLDCAWNQDNSCSRTDRKCKIGTGGVEIEKPEDVELAPPTYKHCRTCCNEDHFKGAVWYRKIDEVEPLTWREALKINRKFIDRHNISEKNLRMRSYPADTLTVATADAQLEKWALEDGFTADIILFDYADIMASNSKFEGTRHAENDKWKSMSGLRHKWNAFICTVTQANATAYMQESLHEGSFSEDKRKYAHVTGFLTLNQTTEEAELGIVRIGRMFTRHLKRTTAQIVVLQNLNRGMVHQGSFFRHKKEE